MSESMIVFSLRVGVRFGRDTNEIRQLLPSLLPPSLPPFLPSSLFLFKFSSYLCAIIKTVAVEKRSRMARWICCGRGGRGIRNGETSGCFYFALPTYLPTFWSVSTSTLAVASSQTKMRVALRMARARQSS